MTNDVDDSAKGATTVSFSDNPNGSVSTRSMRQHENNQTRANTGIGGFLRDTGIRNGERLKAKEGDNSKKHAWMLILPWTGSYKLWWGVTVTAAIATIFVETYLVAFATAGLAPYRNASSILQYTLVSIFVVDIGVNFDLAYFNDVTGDIVCDRKRIARHYARFMLWVDIIGVFPFYPIALACAGQLGENSTTAQYLGLLRLASLVRLHRVHQLVSALEYSTKLSLLTLTLGRNFAVALVWTHLSACIIFFISRQYAFDDNTWIGGSIADLSSLEQYTTTLYWSVVTFTTVGMYCIVCNFHCCEHLYMRVWIRWPLLYCPSCTPLTFVLRFASGYGDFSPQNSAEQIFGMVYMFINIILHSWIIGSITLLIVKHDEKTGAYRDTLQVLDEYSTMHSFDKQFKKRLRAQIKLDFNNREISDEQVLQHFPSSMRRKVLRRLYLPSLIQTSLMKDVRQQFVDAFLTTCSVEIFSQGEELLQRGSISSDLYLLVGGTVELLSWDSGVTADNYADTSTRYGSSNADSEFHPGQSSKARKLHSGNFVNEIEFFTESPQIDTVRTVTVCKTLTMSRAGYKLIADDHPGSVGRILRNLLSKVEEIATEKETDPSVSLPKRLELLRAGSEFDKDNIYADPSSQLADTNADINHSVTVIQNDYALTRINDLVKMHIGKQKDDQTTRFLFAASRGDTATISLMCEHGFDPNSTDYDARTALMVGAMKGNTDVVMMLLEYHANPNLVDMAGASALYEAARNGQEAAMNELLQKGAELCMSESRAASTLCQAVFDGDMLTLRRLLRANIQVNAADYDKRTATHIAAAEGNVVALKILVEYGANARARDRWNHSIEDEARSANAGQILEFLKTVN
jgi:ankyrin repeat protein